MKATRDGAVNQHGEIEFALDVGAVLDVETVDLLAFRASLRGDEVLAEHLLSEFLDVFLAEGEANAALFAGFRLHEFAFAAAASVDLRFNDPERSGKCVDSFLDIVQRQDGHAVRDRRAERFQHGFGLVFVDVHSALALFAWSAPAGSLPQRGGPLYNRPECRRNQLGTKLWTQCPPQ
jgi:hypothetical protein